MNQAALQNEYSPKENVLYLAFDLGNKNWQLAFSRGGSKISEHGMIARDLDRLTKKIESAKGRLGLKGECRIVSCYEAGRDGFWLHRELERRGIQNRIVDPSSIEVSRRARKAKTDRLDAKKLLELLVSSEVGREKRWSVLRVPTVEEEDQRRPQRERERLIKERAAHSNRIRSLLVLHGVNERPSASLPQRLNDLRGPDGQPLPERLKIEIMREWDRWDLVAEQIKELEAGQQERVLAVVREETSDTIAHRVHQMTQLVAIGPVSAWTLSGELFAWRHFSNRRELAAAAGLTPTPFASGSVAHEQGISKAGNRRVRKVIVEIAWGWLRHQPESELSLWYKKRFGSGTSRQRRVGIVALARKLLIALWRFVEHGAIPEGALVS